MRFILLALGCLALGLGACRDEYTTDPSQRLTYSTDTLAFDTVFSTIATPVRIVKVYNFTKEDIEVESVDLYAERNCFRLNLNGVSGTSFSHIALRAKDSLYIFVQVLVDEIGENAPLQIEGAIAFRYNGNHEKVVLTTLGQDAHLWRNRRITSDTTLTNDKPFLVYDSLIVDENATLTIEEGVRFYMHDKATIQIDGSLHIKGQYDQPVVFRGDRFDEIFSGRPYDRINNQWGGIRFGGRSTNNQIDNSIIRNGNFGIIIETDSALMERDEYRLILSNSEIHNTQQASLKTTMAKVYAYNTLFTNGGNGGVVMQGGGGLFNHCTIASYQKGAGYFNNAVVVADKELFSKDIPTPIDSIEFNNCIIYGTGEREVNDVPMDEVIPLPFRFNRCLVKYGQVGTAPTDDQHYRETIWNLDPQFLSTNSAELLYDFHLTEESPAIGVGDAALLQKYPECMLDRYGNPRDAEHPDLGACQWTASKDDDKQTD